MHMMTCQILVLGQNTRGVTYCMCRYEINRYPRALQSVTADFCADRLFNIFFCMAATEAAHLELSGHRPACFTLNY